MMDQRRRQLPARSVTSLGVEQGKIPPQSVDLEQCVLSCLIAFPNSIDTIIDRLMPEAFYRDEHQTICRAIMEMHENNQQTDLPLITEELRKRKQLEEVGGPVKLAQLSVVMPTTAHLQEHYNIVLQKYMAREMIRITSNSLNLSFDESVDIEDLLTFHNNEVDKLNELMVGKKQISHISQIVERSEKELKNREKAAREGKLVGIRTPLTELDKILLGWQPGLYVVAARPSMGKTGFLLACAKSAAMVQRPSIIYSLEMSDVRLSDRLLIGECDFPSFNYRSGSMTTQYWTKFYKAKETIRRLPIYIDDNPIVNFGYIKAHTRSMRKRGLCDIIFLDYLQLTQLDSQKGSNRDIDIGKLTRNLVTLWKQLEIPIVILSQLNRDVEQMRDKRPNLSHLRESGAIEGDADCVMFLHRQEVYNIMEDEKGRSNKGVGTVIVAKNRDGGLGDVKFNYNQSLTKIWDWVDPDKEPMKAAALSPKEIDLDPFIPEDQMPF